MRKREPWFWIYLGTAVVMLCAIAVFVWSVAQSRREGGRVTASESPGGTAALATFFPPAYRGAQPPSPDFAAAIGLYSNRNYAAAVPALRSVVNANPDLAGARFYLGVSELYTGSRNPGVADLRKVADADGPYREQARFYLAKGLLAAGDVAGARTELNEVIALHGDMGAQAETLLARLK